MTLNMFASSAVSCVIFAALLQLARGQCDSGWLEGTESCYKIVQTKQQWPNAKTECEAMGAHLVVVMTMEENHFLQTQLRKLHTDAENQFWMDGTDIQTENNWVWERTGDADWPIYNYERTYRCPRFEVTDWYPGEPNQNGGEEDCLTFYTRFNFKWNDEHCDKPESYICEIEKTTNVIG